MSGAAYMSALAAYRTGAGLCRILTDEENRAILQGQIPEAVLLTYDGARAEADGEAFKEMVAGAVKQATAIVLGPGLGRSEARGFWWRPFWNRPSCRWCWTRTG